MPAPVVFVLGAVAIASPADPIRRATAILAARVGTATGGLLDVTRASAAAFGPLAIGFLLLGA